MAQQASPPQLNGVLVGEEKSRQSVRADVVSRFVQPAANASALRRLYAFSIERARAPCSGLEKNQLE